MYVPQPSVYIHVSQEECKLCLSTRAIGMKLQHPHNNQVSLKLANSLGGKLGILPCMVINKSHNTSLWEENVFLTQEVYTHHVHCLLFEYYFRFLQQISGILLYTPAQVNNNNPRNKD